MSIIEFYYEDINPLKINNNHIIRYIKQLIINEIKKCGGISVIFCSDNYLLEINKEYLKHNYYTDIITFDYVEDDIISGDLFISLERIKENAISNNINFKEELYRVIFHGILHLVGYNDKTEEEQIVMRNKENYYLNSVDFSDKKL